MSDPTTPAEKKHLSEAEWAEAKALFELGKGTKSDLAKKYGVDRSTMGRGLDARGAVYGAKSGVIGEATIEAHKSDAMKRVDDIRAMREKQRKLIETTQALASKAIMDSLKDKVPISSKKADVQTLYALMALFSKGRAELWEIYGLNDDKDAGDEMPEFAVSEYTAEEIEQINRSRLGDANPEDILDQLEQAAGLSPENDDLDSIMNGVGD